MTSEQKAKAWAECARRDGDEEAASGIDALLAALAAERKRREKAEDYLYEEQQAHTAALVRAETAERERDEALRMWREYKAAKDADVASAEAARERAEADNAALLRTVQPLAEAVLDTRNAGDGSSLFLARDSEPGPEVLDASALEGLLAAYDTAHPGAALLERMQRAEEGLRKIAAAVGEWAHTEECDHDEDDGESPPCECGKGEVLALLAALKPAD